MNTDTYHPPTALDELSQIIYDFGYREAQLGNEYWGSNVVNTLDILCPISDRSGQYSLVYSLGYRHGSIIVWEDRIENQLLPQVWAK